jgi:hypothetical protein
MLFTPTTNVLVTGSGLSAGPPKMITTSSGAFSLDLEAGDYTVSLPLITYRAPFRISVFATNGTVNITNLLSPPITYTYTNWLATPHSALVALSGLDLLPSARRFCRNTNAGPFDRTPLLFPSTPT